MTTNDIRKKITSSSSPDWFNKADLEVNLSHLNINFQIIGISTVFDFLATQINGWEKKGDNLPEEFVAVKTNFKNFLNRVLALLDMNYEYERTNHWQQLKQEFNGSYLSSRYFTFDAPETEFLLDIFRKFPASFNAAYNFIINSLNTPFNNKDNSIGTLLAYEFIVKDSTAITERRNAEKASLSSLRNNFQQYLSQTETDVVDYIKQTGDKYKQYSLLIDKTKDEKEKLFEDWFQSSQQTFSNFDTSSNNRIAELEELYRQKLKLEAPAKYWNNRASTLRREGYWWLGGLIVSIGITVCILLWVLSKTADGTIERIFNNTGIAIKWSVVLVTLISFLTFAIRTFSKLTFSSFHLVRDAEEREQLTYVYLALQKEKGIDETERHLIMQSLFSRADSGLLKDDASPTMPGNIIDKIVQK